MDFHLENVSTIIISPNEGKYIERLSNTQNLCKLIGMKNVSHYKSGTNYKTCLLEAVVDIMRKQLTLDDFPFLILEDDIQWNGQTFLRIPEECDAVWLGASSLGSHKTEMTHSGKSILSNFSKDLARVHNMLSGHAMLFCSRKYAIFVRDILEKFIHYPPDKVHKDVILSQHHNIFNIQTPIPKPWFYQDQKYGGNEKQTNINSEDYISEDNSIS